MYEGEHRPLGLILLFSIISLGFFNFYWAYIVSYELKQVSGDDKIKPVFEGIAKYLSRSDQRTDDFTLQLKEY